MGTMLENGLKGEAFWGLILALGAFLLAMFLTPIYTHFAYKKHWWKQQKTETMTGDKLPVMSKLHAHKFKRAFPTMAGLVGIVTVSVVTYICNWTRGETWLPLAGFLGGAFVGLIDDLINVLGKGKGAAGLRAPVKFILITLIGLVLGWFFVHKLGWTSVYVPFINAEVEFGYIGMLILFAFAVVATSNAVNISDGLDGLAGGLAMIAYGAYGAIALFQGQIQLFAFCMTVVGWLLSYVWFNVPPARFMMGDTGSFALGAGLGVVAMMTDAFFLLPIIGIIFVVEAGSSLLQIFWKKVFKKKLFISAPIHHHLEAKGWGEAKIVMRFWVIAGIFAIIGVFMALSGGIVH
ncbi:MAG: phospho-N-acetylmuramoyl-pentapeptide-transferase [Candidatus Saccharibacteria bacterium]|nr:phospho-N-acetylmuramoyl-pentapeptide-transferase [Candidatus Saccharibacteria bacterium]